MHIRSENLTRLLAGFIVWPTPWNSTGACGRITLKDLVLQNLEQKVNGNTIFKHMISSFLYSFRYFHKISCLFKCFLFEKQMQYFSIERNKITRTYYNFIKILVMSHIHNHFVDSAEKPEPMTLHNGMKYKQCQNLNLPQFYCSPKWHQT